MIDTNVKGLVHMTRAILPGMVAANHGHIINIGSIAANCHIREEMFMVPLKHL